MKSFVGLFVVLLVLTLGLGTYMQFSGDKVLEKNGIIAITEEERQEIAEDMVTNLKENMIKQGFGVIGVKYVLGREDPNNGFDCSGFIYWLEKSNGIKTKRKTAKAYASYERAENPQRGDLALFQRKGKIVHIGMLTVIAEKLDKWMMLHASSSKGIIESFMGSYWTPQYIYSVKLPIGRLKENEK